MCVQLLQSCPTPCDPVGSPVARQAPLPMGFSRQEYWTGLPFASPGDLPDPGIEPMSLVSPALADRFFTSAPSGKLELVCPAAYWVAEKLLEGVGRLDGAGAEDVPSSVPVWAGGLEG